MGVGSEGGVDRVVVGWGCQLSLLFMGVKKKDSWWNQGPGQLINVLLVSPQLKSTPSPSRSPMFPPLSHSLSLASSLALWTTVLRDSSWKIHSVGYLLLLQLSKPLPPSPSLWVHCHPFQLVLWRAVAQTRLPYQLSFFFSSFILWALIKMNKHA